MRIRSIKPEFWRSTDIAELHWDHRLVFIGLWSYVDDNGVGRDDWRIITAELFALEDALTEPSLRVQEALNVLSEQGLIVRYAVDGKRYIEIPSWDRHQVINRPSKPRFPRSDAPSAIPHAPLTEHSLSPQRTLSAGTGEQGSSGTGEQGADSSSEIAVAIARPEIDLLLDLLDSEIERNGGKKPARTKKNIDAVRLLLDKDERTVEQVAAAIRWCQADEFWRSNILSMSKLREKYDQLRLAAARNRRADSPQLSKAARNAAEYQRIFGGDHEHAGSIPALDARIGA